MEKILLATFIVATFAFTSEAQRRYFDLDAYLQKYHYMGAGVPDPVIRDMMKTDMRQARRMGIMMFQKKWHLNETGHLDRSTKRLMRMPRCGMADINTMNDMPDMSSVMGRVRERIRHRRYVPQGSKWPRDQLTYRISVYTPDLPQAQVDEEIRLAFKVWSDVTPLDFTQIHDRRQQVDIDVRFTPTSHGDGYDFDGPGGTLAHAFYPQYGGASHFDESETWTIGTYQGINLFQVAAHEFGHALGLAHSNEPGALMAPFYAGYIPDFTLPRDDILGIQEIYGRPSHTRTTTTRKPVVTNPPTVAPTRPPTMPDMCQDGRIDAITTQVIQGRSVTHVFRGNYYMQVDERGIKDGFPRLISNDWPGIRTVDAALTLEYEIYNRRYRYRTVTYLFSRNEYFKYVNMDMVDHGSLTDWGLPSNIDAIFQYSGDGKIYAIKGNVYYTIPGISSMRVHGGARPLSDWGVDRVDATFMATNGRGMRDTIFFRDDRYYKISEATGQVAPGYPRSTPDGWLGCNKDDDGNILFSYMAGTNN